MGKFDFINILDKIQFIVLDKLFVIYYIFLTVKHFGLVYQGESYVLHTLKSNVQNSNYLVSLVADDGRACEYYPEPPTHGGQA